MSDNVVDFAEFARSNTSDGGANLACPKCGNEWWACPGIVIDADTGDVGGYGYPLTCVECGHEVRPNRGVSL